MGKKNSKRSDKSFRAIKNGTDKEMKAFQKWLEDQLSEVSHLPLPTNVDHSMGATIAQMTMFWFNEPRVGIFLACCRDQDLFSHVYWFKIQDLYDAGQFELARPWVITFHIALHLANLEKKGQIHHEWQLVELAKWAVEYDGINKTRDQLMISDHYLGNAYYYARSTRVSLAHFLIVTAAAYLNRHEKSYYSFSAPYIAVFIKFDWLNPRLLKINSSTQLKTLVMMFTNGPIADYEVRFGFGVTSIIGERKMSSDELNIRVSDLYSQMRNSDIVSSTDVILIAIVKKQQIFINI
jgi:hypothetical protein